MLLFDGVYPAAFPIIITEVDQRNEPVQREVFGPVVTVQRFTQVKHVMAKIS
jgi:acyl-CoA reductase-like NAD-dependent aldehyde dehydrogenase